MVTSFNKGQFFTTENQWRNFRHIYSGFRHYHSLTLAFAYIWICREPYVSLSCKFFTGLQHELGSFNTWCKEEEIISIPYLSKEKTPNMTTNPQSSELREQRIKISSPGLVMNILSFSEKYIFHTHKIVACHQITIWGLRSNRIKKLKKTDPHFFFKRMGVCFQHFLDPSHCYGSNRNLSWQDWFMRKIYKKIKKIIWPPLIPESIQNPKYYININNH